MKSIDKVYTNEIIIKNSRFITILYPIKNLDDIKKYLVDVRSLYPKANHYCYGYRFRDMEKASDDNEPSNTAGMPMLGVLQKEDVNNILAITVRYFGGIKLGAGGLVRAYAKGVKLALDKASLKELVKGYLVELIFPYNEQNKIVNLLKDMTILQKEFLEDVKYLVEVPKDKLQVLESYNYKIIKEVDIIK